MFDTLISSFKSKWVIVAALVALLIVGYSVSCITTQDGKTLLIEQITDEDYAFLTAEVEILARLGTRNILANHAESKDLIKEFVEYSKTILDVGNNIDLNNLANDLLANIKDPDLQDALKLAIIEIQRRGGFTYIDVNGQQVLSPRSVGLLKAVIHGVESAL